MGVSLMAAMRDVFRSRAFIAGTVQSVLWLALGVALIHQAPSFDKIFKDFGVELPGLTIAVLKLGHFLVYLWYLCIPPIMLWPLVNWGVVQLVSPNRILQQLWRVATWTLPLVCAAIVACGLFLPLIKLIVTL
jgi:type II secretory pathway component PulF